MSKGVFKCPICGKSTHTQSFWAFCSDCFSTYSEMMYDKEYMVILKKYMKGFKLKNRKE